MKRTNISVLANSRSTPLFPPSCAAPVLLALLALVFLPLVIITTRRHKRSTALVSKTPLQRYRYTSAARGRRLHAGGALDSEHTAAGKSYEYEGANSSSHFTQKTPALWTALSILYLLLILASLLMSEWNEPVLRYAHITKLYAPQTSSKSFVSSWQTADPVSSPSRSQASSSCSSSCTCATHPRSDP